MNDSWTLVLILSALWAGCGASPPTIDAGPPLSDAGSSDAGASNDAGATGSTVTGSVNGTTPFGTVATALWIGAADSAATTVVYLFNKSVTCAELSPAGWDARITDNTEVLELKMYGTAPASYAVTRSLTPAPGEASVNHTFSKRTGTPAEQFSTGGTVTLRAVNPSSSALGSFALTFPSGSLNGEFNAVFCPTGVEP